MRSFFLFSGDQNERQHHQLSADTSALTDSLSKIAEEITAMKDAVSSSAAAKETR